MLLPSSHSPTVPMVAQYYTVVPYEKLLLFLYSIIEEVCYVQFHRDHPRQNKQKRFDWAFIL